VGERRLSPGCLSEEDTAYAYERRGVTAGVIKNFDDRVHYHASAKSAYGVESRPGATRGRRGETQDRVEDGVSCRNVDEGPEELYEVVL
jgi:hypothetical protein